MSRREQKRLTATAVALMASFGAGCGSTDVNTPVEPAGATEPGKYEQTWKTSYGKTICTAWLTKMDDHQRWVAAADMLTGDRKTHGSDDLPADSLVDTFRDGITTACVVPDYPITDIGVGLYISEKERFAP